MCLSDHSSPKTFRNTGLKCTSSPKALPPSLCPSFHLGVSPGFRPQFLPFSLGTCSFGNLSPMIPRLSVIIHVLMTPQLPYLYVPHFQALDPYALSCTYPVPRDSADTLSSVHPKLNSSSFPQTCSHFVFIS